MHRNPSTEDEPGSRPATSVLVQPERSLRLLARLALSRLDLTARPPYLRGVDIRCAVVAALVLGILAAPLAVEAQEAGKVPRIGFLRAGPPPRDFVDGFRQGLRELGYVEGQNIIIDYRFTDGTTAQLANLAAELLQRKVDVVLASGTEAVLATKALTQTVPIVLAGVNDPVDSGLVDTLSRPGGNITGVSLMSVDLVAKRV